MTTAAEQDPAQMLNRAVLAFQAGRLGEAEQLCQKVIAISHDSFDALYLLGFVQSRRGKPDEALASYDRALRLRPDLAQVYFNRGDFLKALK